MCFTSYSDTTDSLYKNVREISCGNLAWIGSKDEYKAAQGEAFDEEGYDNSIAAKQACLSGAFEEINGSKKTLAINYISGVTKANFTCFGNIPTSPSLSPF
jgi:hypothetical protein